MTDDVINWPAESGAVREIVSQFLAVEQLRRLEAVIAYPRLNTDPQQGHASRAEIAFALHISLFVDLLSRVPAAQTYVSHKIATKERIFLDHGALRTVGGISTGALPQGAASIIRLLAPLGYRLADLYPLTRLKMTGYAYTHCEAPQQVPQFFVSELDLRAFSLDIQSAVEAIFSCAIDPLSNEAIELLGRLEAEHRLTTQDAGKLVPMLAGCFARHHPLPTLEAYETFRRESEEMAWISTEGQAFNHATSRVTDLQGELNSIAHLQLAIKPHIETSASGTILQTAVRASLVDYTFSKSSGGFEKKQVPGSFFEFIERKPLPGLTNRHHLDLRFDSGNAQQIFKMTAASAVVQSE